MATDSYTITPFEKPLETQGMILEINESFSRIERRLDEMQGYAGNPKYGNHLNANSYRVNNLGDPASPSDALNLRTADDRYVQKTSGILDRTVLGAIPGIAIDAGQSTVTGTLAVPTRLAAVTSACVSLNQDASINAYPGVTVTWAGNVLTIACWKPTSATDPTPIAATNALTVSWQAVGYDLTGGAEVASATGGSSPSGGGGGSTPGGGGGGGGFGGGLR